MKLITALKLIEEREKRKRKAEKEQFRQKALVENQLPVMEPADLRKQIHVQSIFPQDDIIALKIKTGELHVKEAIIKAVYFFLQQEESEDILESSVSFRFRWH